jgi:hypothetical protein
MGQTLAQLRPRALDDIKRFFFDYNQLHDKKFEVRGQHGPNRAAKCVSPGEAAFGKKWPVICHFDRAYENRGITRLFFWRHGYSSAPDRPAGQSVRKHARAGPKPPIGHCLQGTAKTRYCGVVLRWMRPTTKRQLLPPWRAIALDPGSLFLRAYVIDDLLNARNRLRQFLGMRLHKGSRGVALEVARFYFHGYSFLVAIARPSGCARRDVTGIG